MKAKFLIVAALISCTLCAASLSFAQSPIKWSAPMQMYPTPWNPTPPPPPSYYNPWGYAYYPQQGHYNYGGNYFGGSYPGYGQGHYGGQNYQGMYYR
jgi:hypothetical protein